jgi:type III restriction enzyme
MTLELRQYQKRSLESLGSYFDEATELGAKRAFVVQTDRPYRSVPQLSDLPYVCLRVPTGGGKTIMAAHAVGMATNKWVHRDRVVCLWLVPSNAIRQQTLLRLKRLGDPYRDALQSGFNGHVSVVDLSEALYVQRSTLDAETVVIVATLAALRITDTEGRKIYEAAGALAGHFDALSPELRGLLECREDGTPIESLANVLRLRRPVVIMDEAHNARTQLAFDSLARFSPSCIVEFTATPATKHDPESGSFASNVLTHVSAAELKAEEMIKLPVKLWTDHSWTETVTNALAKQRELEEVAVAEQALTGERIRPIVLFQAQTRREGERAITAEVLKQALVDDHRVPQQNIAIETGTTRELEDVDLSDPGCPIRYVITVQALREGWDCPTAYILCSIGEQASPRAVEQLLGRVLRLPQARRKRHEALNVAYAYVVSGTFASAAGGLRDALVEAGFEKLETATMVEDGSESASSLFSASPSNPVAGTIGELPNEDLFASLALEVRTAILLDGATHTLQLTAPLSVESAEQLATCYTMEVSRAYVRELARESRGEDSGVGPIRPYSSLATDRMLTIPLLAVRTPDGELELFEESQFLDTPWRVADCDSDLTDMDFSLNVRGGQSGALDITAAGRLEISFQDTVANQLSLLEGEPGWTVASLAVWLDAHIPHSDLPQSDVRLFIHKSLESLAERGGVTVLQLAREKYRLRKSLESKIASYRVAQRRVSYQRALFEGGAGTIEVSEALSQSINNPSLYSPNWLYEGPFRFQRHLFRIIGELPESGEEHDCAIHLDQNNRVEYWLRNISNRPDQSFWLQTATDRFYPDFVGRLKDGRVFAVEYKGEHLWTNDDSREKRAVGNLWAAASGGRCIFVMPKGRNFGEIEVAFQD